MFPAQTSTRPLLKRAEPQSTFVYLWNIVIAHERIAELLRLCHCNPTRILSPLRLLLDFPDIVGPTNDSNVALEAELYFVSGNLIRRAFAYWMNAATPRSLALHWPPRLQPSTSLF